MPTPTRLRRAAPAFAALCLLLISLAPLRGAARGEPGPVHRGLTRLAASLPHAETFGAIARRSRAMGPTWPAVPLPERLRGINPPANELLTPELAPGAVQEEFVVPPGRRRAARAAARPAAGPRPRATPLPEVEFDTIADTGSIPPDDALATSGAHMVTSANSALQIRSLTGTLLGASSFNAFFPTEPTRFMFDPRLCFDAATQRFYFCAVGRNGGSEVSTIVLAVTATSDPTGVWNKYVFTVTRTGGSGKEWADYPSLGYDDNALYISVNMFTFAANEAKGTRTLILSKATAMAGGALSPTILEDLLLPSPPFVANSPAFTLKPVEAATSLTQGLLICNAGQFGLCLYKVNNPLSAPTVTSAFIDTADFPLPGNAPQKDTSSLLDSGDFRLQKTVFRSGRIWTCHTVSSSGAHFGRAMVLFHVVDAAASTLEDSIPLDDPARAYYYPAILPDANGNAMAVFQGSTSTEYSGIYHARYLGALFDFEAPVLTEPGAAGYSVVAGGRVRWGDYTDACLDPRNDSKVWIQGELATTSTTWKKRAALIPVTVGAPSTDAFEPDDTSPDAKVIANGETQNRSVHAAGNEDWARFTLSATSNITVESTGETRLQLFGPDSASNLLDEDSGSGGEGAVVSANNQPAGSYFIRCREETGAGTIHNYQLTLSHSAVAGADAFEPDDAPGTARQINSGTPQSRNIHVAGNEDWAFFNLAATSDFRVEATGDTEMWVYGPNSSVNQVGYDPGTGALSMVTATAQPVGTYLIRVREFENNATIAAYTLSLTITAGGVAADAFEPDDSAAAAKIINDGATQDRTIHAAGNDDWARFIVTRPSSARIETRGPDGDTVLSLFGPDTDATFIAGDDDSGEGLFSLIDTGATLLAPGVYFIKVEEFGDNGTIAAYQLSLTLTLGPDAFEPDNSPAAAAAITNGSVQNRNLHLGADEDWATFTLTAARNVVIETNGPAGDTVLELFSPESTLIATDDDSGPGAFSRIERSGAAALPAGQYWIRVTEFGRNDVLPEYTLALDVTAAPSLTLLSPNGGETLIIGKTAEVRWTSSDYPGRVRLEFSPDNGATWRLIVSRTLNDGSHNWKVPKIPSAAALVRISGMDGPVSPDVSDGPFAVNPSGKLKASPAKVVFGTVNVGSSADRQVTIQNIGAGPLRVEIVPPPGGFFTIVSGGGVHNLGPGATAPPLVLRFNAGSAGAKSDSLTLLINEAKRSSFRLRLIGRGR